MKYLVNKSGKQLGPYNPGRLRYLLNSGFFSDADQIWIQDRQEWISLGSFFEESKTQKSNRTKKVKFETPSLAAHYMHSESEWKRPSTWFALILLISFFLPWISFGSIINVAGYQIPGAMRSVGKLADFFGASDGQRPDWKSISIYALFLAPILSGISLFLATTQNQNSFLCKILAAVITPACLLMFWGNELQSVFENLAFGGWLAVISSVLLLCSAFLEGQSNSL